MNTIKIFAFIAAVAIVPGNASAENQEGIFDKKLIQNGISFHVSCSNEGSLNYLEIIPAGLTIDNSVVAREIDGTVTGAEVNDLNGDGFPEIYVYINSAGSGSYGSLVAYSSNNNKSISEIYMPPLEEDTENSEGYMGHDEFTVMDGTLVRRFPIYKKDDSNAIPTGGMRQLQYVLAPGEAGWIVQLINSKSF